MELGKNMFKRKTLPDDIVEYLMDKFAKKEFKPGDRIIETKIADELNVSQGAVREAISILISMGFLERKPFKGARFKIFTIKELLDYQKVREELEVMALNLAIIDLDYKKIDIPYLKDITNKMFSCVKNNDYKGRTDFDLKFHKHLVKASNNKSLEIAWNSLGNYYWAYIWLYLDLETLEKRTFKHRPICDSLKNRDYEMSIGLIKKHFGELSDLVLEIKDLN